MLNIINEKKKIALLAKGRHNIFVVHGFKPTTKLKLVERTEALRVLTLLAVVASPRTGGVQGCRLAAAADPEITPEHQSCRHLASTIQPQQVQLGLLVLVTLRHDGSSVVFLQTEKRLGQQNINSETTQRCGGKSMYSSLVVI